MTDTQGFPSSGEGSGSAGAGRPPVRSVALPTARLVTMSFVVGAFAGLFLWGVSQAFRPQAWDGIAVGTVAGVLGTVVGVLVIKPWVVRPLNVWPMLMLASQGIGFFGTLLVGGLLYSTPRPPPDPYGLAAGCVVSFVGAVIGHARVFDSCVRRVGPSTSSAAQVPPAAPGSPS